MYSIVVFNDDVTTAVFVIKLLVQIFDKSLDEAHELTMKIDQSEKQAIGQYSKEVAEQKLYEASQFCKIHEQTLKIKMERM
jgi:ATP-dependent Clp protease adaptor protein ClpS